MLFFILFDFVKFQRRKRRFKFQVSSLASPSFRGASACFRFGYAELKVQEIL